MSTIIKIQALYNPEVNAVFDCYALGSAISQKVKFTRYIDRLLQKSTKPMCE